jgi:hypothetical protein
MSKVYARCATHRIYAVERRRTKNARWIDIGAAWTHPDGKGFDLELQTVPLTAAELVVRIAGERSGASRCVATATSARSG